MLLRLLGPAASGTTWYGKWGYGFGGRAPYAIHAREYALAVAAVHGAPLSSVIQDLTGIDEVSLEVGI
jgi:hypothetical protein